MHNEQSESIARALHEIPRGLLPKNVFFEVARILVTPLVEIVPLHVEDGKIYVLLTERPADDPLWGGMQHTPGTILLSTDKPGDLTDAFSRVLEKELDGPQVSDQPVFVTIYFHDSKRGRELAHVYWCEIMDHTPKTGKYYPVDNLPGNLINTQKDFILDAIKHFKAFKKLN